MTETVYDEVKGVIYIKSNFAVRIRLRNGRVVWIPDSLIINLDELIHYGCPDYQILKVARWFCLKLNLDWNGWF